MDHLRRLIERYPQLAGIEGDLRRAYELLAGAFEAKGKLLIAGNGGSAADADHIAGELMKGFVKKRAPPPDFISALNGIDGAAAEYLGKSLQRALPCINLSAHAALTTACANDLDGGVIYAQQVYGYGGPGDVFLGISTSGGSKNVLYAMITARAMGLKTIALTGGSGGAMVKYAEVSVIVPETETYKIQELHLPVYHALCLALEERFFP